MNRSPAVGSGCKKQKQPYLCSGCIDMAVLMPFRLQKSVCSVGVVSVADCLVEDSAYRYDPEVHGAVPSRQLILLQRFGPPAVDAADPHHRSVQGEIRVLR